MKSLINNKKGQEEGSEGFSTALWLVILVIGVIIIVLFIPKEISLAGQLSEDAICYNSLRGSVFSSEELVAKCPVKEYIVYGDSLKERKDGKLADSDLVKDFSAGDNKVNELFAKLMGKCLQRGGGVNSNIFGRKWLTSGTICLECAQVEFDRTTTKDNFPKLHEYLETTNAPGDKKKYIDYLSKDAEHKEDWINFGFKYDLIPGKYEYSIVKDNIYSVFFIGIKESTVKALYKGKLLDREDVYFVYTSNQENVGKICDRKVN